MVPTILVPRPSGPLGDTLHGIRNFTFRRLSRPSPAALKLLNGKPMDIAPGPASSVSKVDSYRLTIGEWMGAGCVFHGYRALLSTPNGSYPVIAKVATSHDDCSDPVPSGVLHELAMLKRLESLQGDAVAACYGAFHGTHESWGDIFDLFVVLVEDCGVQLDEVLGDTWAPVGPYASSLAEVYAAVHAAGVAPHGTDERRIYLRTNEIPQASTPPKRYTATRLCLSGWSEAIGKEHPDFAGQVKGNQEQLQWHLAVARRDLINDSAASKVGGAGEREVDTDAEAARTGV